MTDDERRGTAGSPGKEDGAEAIRKRLLTEALRLPPSPGVYIMKDASGSVIYVGKSRRLRDRVSQYFRDTDKSIKTERMTSSVRSFECIVCESEIEALALENNLIKKYSPKYNIKLKDAKSYPYIKMTSGPYPVPVMTRKRTGDGGVYFGPFSGTATVYSLIDLIRAVFRLPSCRMRFPEDIGKKRPCIYYEMGRCCGVCTGKVSREEYAERVASACGFLRGEAAEVKDQLRKKMEAYAEAERFEAAAACRDTIAALDRLADRQKVSSDPGVSRDAAAISRGGGLSAMSVLRIRGGSLIDKMDYMIDKNVHEITEAALSLLAEHYRSSGDLPPELLLGEGFSEEDAAFLSEYLTSLSGKKLPVSLPKRGEKKKLCGMAEENAALAAEREAGKAEKSEEITVKLASLLALETLPRRIEAYDISNMSDEHITAGMTVTVDGSFKKSDYRFFSVRGQRGADDYAAMREALTRRLARLKAAKEGTESDTSFSETPDLILVDGGRQHLETALSVMEEAGFDIPVAGMVKDGGHRTRALVTRSGECDISGDREVFVFIYRIQEEIHRFTLSRMTNAKRKTVRHSSLEKIKGIGPSKASALLAAFGGLSALKKATKEEICAVKGISESDAEAVFAALAGR